MQLRRVKCYLMMPSKAITQPKPLAGYRARSPNTPRARRLFLPTLHFHASFLRAKPSTHCCSNMSLRRSSDNPCNWCRCFGGRELAAYQDVTYEVYKKWQTSLFALCTSMLSDQPAIVIVTSSPKASASPRELCAAIFSSRWPSLRLP